jgi:cytoskeletal protein RodZ
MFATLLSTEHGLYSIIFYLKERAIYLKDIGEKLRASREEAGLSLEEVAEDLKLDIKKLQSIEEGNKEVFKDIYDLKYCIRDYAKYLCLDYEQLVNDFNEFVFEYTSKIPIAAIESASKDNKETEKKITSPYTMETNNKTIINIRNLIIITVILLVVSIITVFVISGNKDNNENANIAALM